MTATNLKFESMALCVQTWGVPFDMASPKVVAEIGGRLGEVALPTAKPLRRGAYLSGTDGQHTWISIKYERLPLLCHCCGLLGHNIKHRAKFFVLKKNSSEVTCQYSD